MSDPLAAYRAELRAAVDQWYQQEIESGQSRTIGASPWSGNLDRLREIDERHGVTPNDPRVYSIAAYKAEREEIEAEMRRLARKSGWARAEAGTASDQERWACEIRFWARLADCRARHFPGMDAGRIDSPAKLWAYITLRLVVVAESVARTHPGGVGRSGAWRKSVRKVYSLLQKLAVPWALAPPYPAFDEGEAEDELTRIANRLERDDALRVSGVNDQISPSVLKECKTIKAKRDKATEARDKWVYEQCCNGVAYDTIARRLSKKNKNWQPITSKQGILSCARKYAERNNLPPPPARQSPP